jgi:glycosyltransferase involved in cell wall biosynthesis
MSNISACILSYNRAEYLCSAIDSILQQTIAPAEILIFDNGSDASVFERIRPYLNQGINWVGSEVNRTAAWNFRRAIWTAKSEYIFVLHDDDRLCSDFIEQQINFLNLNPDVGAVTCNGYLINERGDRTGRLLRGDDVAKGVEYYRSPAAVAICYATDSCLPFSPAVYRADFVKTQDLREEFGKVVDAVFFCDLVKNGSLAYQLRPLYECRVHGLQDSSYFPTIELEQLTSYFESAVDGSSEERNELNRLLVQQHTSRYLRSIYHAVFHRPRVSRFLFELQGVFHRRFSFLAAFCILVTAMKKRFINR